MNATSPNSSRGGEDFSLWPPQFPSLNTILLFFFSTIVIIIARIWLVAEDPVEKRLRLREERKRKRKEERQKEGVKVVVYNPNPIYWLCFVIESVAYHYHNIQSVPIYAVVPTSIPPPLSFTAESLILMALTTPV